MSALGWQDRAACRGEDVELFFPVGSAGPENIAQTKQAKAVCGRCPVREDCLKAALDRREKFGIFGGTTWDERDRMLRNSRRRKAAA